MQKFSTFISESSIMMKHKKTGELKKFTVDGPRHMRDENNKRYTSLQVVGSYEKHKPE
jgi:hypothetical protein